MTSLKLFPRRALAPSPSPGRSTRRRARELRLRRTTLLPFVDLLVAALAGVLWIDEPIGVVLYVLAVVPLLSTIEGYAPSPLNGRSRELPRTVAHLALAAMAAQWLAYLATEQLTDADEHAGALWLMLTTLGMWLVVRAGSAYAARAPERVVIVGSGVVADRLVAVIARHAKRRLKICGYLDAAAPAPDGTVERLGCVRDLHRLLAEGRVDRVMVAFTADHTDAELVDALRECDATGVPIDVVPRLFEFIGSETRSYMIGGLPLTTVSARGGRVTARLAKRTLDVAVSLGILVFLAPLMLLLALLIWLEDRGPVMFRQERTGLFGRSFSILKLRTMRQDASRDDVAHITRMRVGSASISDVVADIKRTGDPRVTRIGRFLRKTSLDEVPQLWNVVRGDMSLVGPRPLRDFEVAALSDWELSRHLERPGITGLWQVTGRSAVPWEERMLLDYMYVRHWSLISDIEILIRTLPAVLAGSGAR